MKSGLRLYIGQNKKSQQALPLLRGVVASLLYLGYLESLLSMFSVSCYQIWVACAGLLVVIALSLFWENKQTIYSILLVLTGLFLIGFLLHSKFILQGFYVFCNQILETIGRQTPYIFSPFAVEVSAQNGMLFCTVFLMFAGGICAALCAIVVCGGHRSLLLVLLIPLLAIQAVFHMTPQGIGVWLLLFGSFLAFVVAGCEPGTFPVLPVSMGIAAAVCLLGVGGAMLLGSTGTSIRPMFEKQFQEIRYGKQSCYPRGRLAEVSYVDKTNEIMLTVTMEQPQAMYLRGFVGSNFASGSWSDLKQTVYYEQYPLFYWLHKTAFYGQTQLAAVRRLAQAQAPVAKQSLSVHHVNERRDCLFLPYETISLGGFSIRDNSDTTAIPTGFYGQSDYSMEITEPLWNQTVSLGRGLFEAQTKPETVVQAQEYLQAESHYNQFVYAYNRTVPEDVSAYFETIQLPKAAEGQPHISYEEAAQIVSTFVGTHLRYEETATASLGNAVSIQQFLSGETTGCDLQYASAVVWLYRYLGIPARYVEGYLVTAKDASLMKPNQAYTLDQTHAHAWAEVYQDTIGWVPVDLTPGYMQCMMQEESQPEQESAPVLMEGQSLPQSTTPTELIPQEEKEHSTLGRVFLIWLLAVLLLLAGIAGRSFWHVKKRNAQFASSDSRTALCAMYGYFVRLMEAAHIPGEEQAPLSYEEGILERFTFLTKEEYELWCETCMQAAFAPESPTEEEVIRWRSWIEQLRTEFLKGCSVTEKLIVYFWECL